MPQMTTNGTPRKQLADQIDRLELTVNNLGDSVREAVREAVTELVSEVLTNPDVAALFRNVQAQPAQAPRPSPLPGGGLMGWLQKPLRLARQGWQTVCRYKGVAVAGLAAVAAVAVAAWTGGPLLALAGLAAAAA
jgi:hypothetical protein